MPKGKQVYFGVSDTGDPASFGEFSTAVSKHPAVIESFRPWGSDVRDSIQRWEIARARPMVHITTADPQTGAEMLSLAAIARGAGDSYLIRLNHLFAEKKMRAYVRPLGEPNRCLNVYAAYECAGNPREAADSARNYRRAFRRIYVIVHGGGKAKLINKRLAEAGLPPLNAHVGGLPKAPVAIVWSPLPSGSPTTKKNLPQNYFPGNEWVDWTGTDFYASYPEWGALTRLYERYPEKPFAITEWGVEAGDDPNFVSHLFAWVESPPADEDDRLLPGLRLDLELPDPELRGKPRGAHRPASRRAFPRLCARRAAPAAAAPGWARTGLGATKPRAIALPPARCG